MSPQWEGDLELDSASDCGNEYEEDGRLVARNQAAENGPKGYISFLMGKLALDLDPGLPLARPTYWCYARLGQNGTTQNCTVNSQPYGSFS